MIIKQRRCSSGLKRISGQELANPRLTGDNPLPDTLIKNVGYSIFCSSRLVSIKEFTATNSIYYGRGSAMCKFFTSSALEYVSNNPYVNKIMQNK